MLSLLTSSKSNGGVLCGGSSTSPGLLLFGSIFFRIFDFIFTAFEPYHIVNVLSFSVLCQFLVSVWESKDLFKINSSFLKTESKVCWTILMFKCLSFCWTILISIYTLD